MANYHLSPKSISRGAGKCAVAAAAYRAGAAMTDERTGLHWDFTRKGGVLHSEIMAPNGCPPWAYDRERLWNEVEKAEDKSTRRDTAKTAREFEVSLPHELSQEDRQAAGLELARHLVDTYGVVADVAFHAPHRDGDERNWHVHILTTTRALSDAGFGAKVRELDSPKTSGAHITAIREKWANIANGYLERAGCDQRIDHRSFEEQGIDREATVHLGPHANGMERKGEETELGDKNREIKATNTERDKLKADHAKVSGQIIDLAEERAKRAAEREIMASVRTHDAGRVLQSITERRSTFTRADLNYFMSKQIIDAKERSAFTDEVLARPETIPLRDGADGPITRYTTRAVLKAEGDLLKDARGLASDGRHGITADRLAHCLDRHGRLDQEQRAAVAHATGPEGMAIIAGEAGTGKSTTMEAVKDAYEAAGKRVVGTAWTNAVVQDMKAEGFRDTTTIAAELMRQAKGQGGWDRNTVVIIDEAAMLATKHLAAVVAAARGAGAKLVLVGDEKQLASIEYGGMFGALRDEHGAAELHTVRRVTDEDQRQAFNQMHRGDFKEALAAFEKRGAIHWTDDGAAARAALVEKYTDDRKRDPSRTRFAFAYTNKEVDALNADIRARRRKDTELGADQILTTKHGDLAFAVGDRVQFTGSGPTRRAKAEGLVNGMVGTLREIDGNRVTVELDTKPGKAPRVVSFSAGSDEAAGQFGAFRHGYAGTIYKGQGKTLDQSYLLHSKQWRSAASYVAMTRHREDVAVFVDKAEAGNIDKLAHQMGRVEEKRAASQFHADDRLTGTADTAAGRRYAALHDAHRAAEAGVTDAAPTDAGKSWRAAMAAERASEAQRIAGRIGRINDPARQANVMRKAHETDAGKAIRPTDVTDAKSFGDFMAQFKRAEPEAKPEQGRTIDRGRGRTR